MEHGMDDGKIDSIIDGLMVAADFCDDRATERNIKSEAVIRAAELGESVGLRRAANLIGLMTGIRVCGADVDAHDTYFRPDGRMACRNCSEFYFVIAGSAAE